MLAGNSVGMKLEALAALMGLAVGVALRRVFGAGTVLELLHAREPLYV